MILFVVEDGDAVSNGRRLPCSRKTRSLKPQNQGVSAFGQSQRPIGQSRKCPCQGMGLGRERVSMTLTAGSLGKVVDNVHLQQQALR